MAYGSTPYVGMTPKKKKAATLKVHKWHARNSALDWSNGSISHIRHYRVLPWATGTLPSLESIAEVPDWQVAKTGKSSIFWLSSSFLSHASTITVEAITTIQTLKNGINHWVLHPLCIVIIAHEPFFSDSQALRCQYLVLYAIFVINNIIHSMYAPAQTGSSIWARV